MSVNGRKLLFASAASLATALTSLVGLAAPVVRPQVMKILPAGAVRPEGYLRTQLVRQAEGLTGHAEELYADIGKSAWAGVKGGDAWERGPYYLKGLLPLAFALDDAALKARTKKWIDSILSLQQPNGYFSARPNNWWANMIALHVLRDWAEATGDTRIEPFLARYFAYQREALKTTPLEKDSCWAIARGGDNLEIVLWLYDRTHDESLLELAALLAAQTQDWNRWYRTGEGSTGFAVHIVNFMQGLKFPALKWRLTGDEAERTAALAAFDPAGWAFSKHGRPDGMLNGTESLSGRAASQGTELCAVAERILSDATSAAVTGEAAFGDRLESIAYNTLPGQVSPDLRGIRYYTLMNQPACLAESLDFRENGERVAASSDMHKAMQGAPAICPGPCAGYGCCRSNFHFAWPKFVQSLWMSRDGGLAAVAYGPCRVKYAGFDLRVTTDYPFRETIRVDVVSAPSAEAPLAFRIPSWVNGACVAVNDCATNGTIPGRFETIRRIWKAGDRIELTFPMEVETTDGWSASGNALSVRRGPLVYAFAPHFRRHRLEKYSLPDFPTYELVPTEPWNWALVRAAGGAVEAAVVDDGKPLAEQPFDPLTPPVALRVKAVRTMVAGWGAMRSDRPGNACEPPTSPLPENAVSPVVDVIRLVPMGCTQVRISEFPWKGAAKWEGGVDARIARGEIDACCAAAVNGPEICRGAGRKSIFEVASVSKTFTALVAARLWCEGKLDIDAPIVRYLPELAFPTNGAAVTVRDLATHSGGLTDAWMGKAGIYGREKFPFDSDEAYFRCLMNVTPSAPRGKAVRYACTNYILLGLIVERASGMDLAAAAKKYVFDPLQMNDTRWREPADLARCVQVYTHGPRPLGTPGDENARAVRRAIGNAGVFTTLEDMLKYAGDLLERRAFEPKCYELLFAPAVEKEGRRRSFGWDMASGTNPPGWSASSINHSGYTGTYVAVDPVGRKAAVVLMNLKSEVRAERASNFEFRRQLCRDLCM